MAGIWRPGSLLMLDDEPADWRPKALADVTPDDFATVIAAGIAVSEFVLLGAGAAVTAPPRAVREALQAAGLGLECMSTEAALRTYGVLMSEGRRVAVALIAV